MKKLFYSVAHSTSPRPKTRLLSVEASDVFGQVMLRFHKSHSFSVYETSHGEILPATYVGEELPMETEFEYSDYRDMHAEIESDAARLVTPGGFVTRRGRAVAEMLNIKPEAETFRKIAMDNMHFRRDLGVTYVTASTRDPEKRDLAPCA